MHCAFVNSIGQSGTHMAAKCLSLLGGTPVFMTTINTVGRVPEDRPAYEQPDFDPSVHALTGETWPGYIEATKLRETTFAPQSRPGQFGASHMLHTPAGASIFRDLGMRMVVIVRDPRDWAVSSFLPTGWTDEAIESHIRRRLFGFDLGLPLIEQCRRLIVWADEPFAMVVRFEDLVGERGGGCDRRQHDAIASIAEFLGLRPYYPLVVRAAIGLFGGSPTFNKGQIGNWQRFPEIFAKPDIADACVEAAAVLGYTK